MAKRTAKIQDYYAIYQLDRNMDTKSIRKVLLKQQGEIRSNMANGSLNSPEILEKLQGLFNDIAAAIKVFKNDTCRKEYDAQLDAAYKAGQVDVEAQKLAQDIFEEIQEMFMKGNYNGVVRRCMDALNNNVRDYRLYILMAQSYFAMNDADNSLRTVENGLRVHPENMQLLKAGARFANEGKHDYNTSQEYINRMIQIEPDSGLAAAEQSYLYLAGGKDDLAYRTIDEYIEKHPNDMEFRKDCAYDLVGHSYSCYTKTPDSDAYVIASEQDYNKCLNICNKAASLYNDENVSTALDNAKYFGQVEFNEENKKNIAWLFVGAIIYLVGGIVTAASGGGAVCVVFFILAALLIASGVMLVKCSYRPYWQIFKFILTGKRESPEGIFVMIGKIFAGYMEYGLKFSWWFLKFIFRLVFHMS